MLIASFFKTGLRGMRRSPGFTLIGILSLSVGMSVWLLLTLLVRDQKQYDRFHDDADRIVRVTSRSWNRSIDLMVPLASSPAGTGPALADALPQVDAFSRVAQVGAPIVTDLGAVDLQLLAADASFFDLFSFDLTRGQETGALARPNTIVLTEYAAELLFDGVDAVGQQVQLGTWGSFEVTAVAANPPRQSHLQFDGLVSMASVTDGHLRASSLGGAIDNWQANDRFWTYLRLAEGADGSLLAPDINRALVVNYPAALRDQYDFQVEALTDVTLVSRDLGNQIGPVVGRRPLYVVSLFALVILLIAVFNYVGLAVSRSVRRSREVGVRKALGAARSHVIQQFLAESLLVSLGSLALSMVALAWIIPVFNDLRFLRLAGVSLSAQGLKDPVVVLSFLGIALTVGLVAGIAPALHLSRFRSARILSGSFTVPARGLRRLATRRSLISLQFAASVFFVVIASTMWRQIDHMLDADFGFERESVVAVDLQEAPFDRFRDSALRSASIRSVAASSALPVAGGKSLTYLQSDSLAAPLFSYWYSVDSQFLGTLDIELIAGRGFDERRESDQAETIILNETAARELGYPDPRDAIDQLLRVGLTPENQSTFRVIGVTEDFIFESDRGVIRRLALFNDPSTWRLAVVAPVAGAGDADADLQRAWNSVRPDLAYSANSFGSLLSVALDPVKDARLVLSIAAGLALFLSCLGLIGFAAFTAETRRQEVGIRKVVGASAFQVTLLLLYDLARLMGIGVLLAIPVMVIALNGALQNFPIRVDLGAVPIALQVGGVVLLGLLVTGFQTLRVAAVDPAAVIRSE